MPFHFLSRGGALVGLTVLLAACNSTNSGPAPVAPIAPASAVDTNFIVGATQSSNSEISAGTLAQQKSTNPDVIAFAQTMVTQHTQEEQTLAPIAATANSPVPPPTSVSPAQAQVAQSLANTPEPAFDALYINSEITGHQANIASNFTPEIQGGSSQPVVAYATSTLPQIQMHLQMAQQIKAKYNF